MFRHLLLILLVWVVASVWAMPSVPRSSYAALGRERGRSIDGGLVFVNGKFLTPPYVVERWGTGLRINGVAVTGQVVAWNDFLKTQESDGVPSPAVKRSTKDVSRRSPKASGKKKLHSETKAKPAEAAKPSAPPAPEPGTVENESLNALDALLGVDAEEEKTKSAKGSRRKVSAKKTVTSASPKAEKKPVNVAAKKTVTSATPKAASPASVPAKDAASDLSEAVADERPFKANEASRRLLARIEAQRADVERQLKAGGFICFGETYSRVTGDARTAAQLLAELPRLEREATDAASLYSAAREANLYYLNEPLCEDFYRNRTDYLSLRRRQAIVGARGK